MTASAQDIGNIRARQDADVKNALIKISRKTGRNPISIWFDFLKLKRGRGKLKFYEYVLYGLYDGNRWSDDARSRFISAHSHWPVSNACNNTTWWAVTEDKWLSSSFLSRHDVAVPQTMAIYDTGPRAYPDAPKLNSAESLKTFFAANQEWPLFAKPMTGMWSAGAMRVNSSTETHVLIEGQEPLSYEKLAGEVFGTQSYLIQKCLTPHSFFCGLTDAIGTVRFLNLISEGGLRTPFAALKLPLQSNVADNFWRQGNMLCNLDPETGEVQLIVDKKDGERVTFDSLPGVERNLVGERLPMWKELRDLNEKTALLHGANRYGSTDIALTEDGPVVVEVNTGCAFEIMQMATGEGFLSDDMLAFFKDCGAQI